MKNRQLALLCAASLAAPAALAQFATATGSVSLTGIHTNVSGENPFRFDEYRDLSSGVTAGVDVRGGTETYFWTLFGENLGRDDQYAEFRGGRYGVVKYSLFVNDIIHNLTHNARTLYSGVGTNNLTFAGPPSTDLATWNTFDYSLQHRNYGGMVELTRSDASPFYVRTEANRKETTGVRPIGGAGTSPGGPVFELPVPVDYTTSNFSAEAGYTSKTAHLSVNAAYSKFEDRNDFVNWRNPIVASGPNTERSTLAADNELWKIGINAMIRQLPLNSSLAVRGTWSKLSNSLPVESSFLSVSGTTGATRLANASIPTFEGEVLNKSLSASLNSQLDRGFDSRLYWNWHERDNRSSHIVFTPGGPGSGGGCDISATGSSLTTCTPEHLNFKKQNLGLELSYRLGRANKLTAGLDWMQIERERFDFDKSREIKATLEWKTSAWDGVTGRLRYQHLQRKSDFLLNDNPDVFNRFLFRFDAAPLDRDVLKIVLDATPVEFVDVGGEIILKRNKYKDTMLGRTKDTRREFYATAAYGKPAGWRVTAFFDVEYTQYDSTHWVGATTTFPVPNAAGTTYLWDAEVKDKNYLAGVAAEWPFRDWLKFTASAIWQRTQGTVDFTTPNNFGNPMDIADYDTFRKRSLNVKAAYAATKNVEVTLGYAYESYSFSDVQMDGYNYTIRTGTTQNFFTGAYAFPSYNANTVYVTLAYRFP